MTPRERADLPYIILLLVNAVLFFVLLATRCSRANPSEQQAAARMRAGLAP
jgi:hypothetical protein